MCRSVRYTAGLIIAAGATLAFAGPASAAPAGPRPNWFSPYTYSAPNQVLGQISVNNQVVLNNVGNPQIGFGNYNAGGTVSVGNWTNQNAGQSVGGLFRF